MMGGKILLCFPQSRSLIYQKLMNHPQTYFYRRNSKNIKTNRCVIFLPLSIVLKTNYKISYSFFYSRYTKHNHRYSMYLLEWKILKLKPFYTYFPAAFVFCQKNYRNPRRSSTKFFLKQIRRANFDKCFWEILTSFASNMMFSSDSVNFDIAMFLILDF